ncbi:MAG TPA: rhomboid family intramembrane serine protease [Thermoanaerobaculia bacterium]|nr:rhomboid family intramembrane serine protease [Thermoanaerobaculia bacterium]
MLILPIGREKGILQRHAWVTYSLVALNIVFFLLFCTGSTDQERGELVRGWRSMISYLRDRPYLRPPVAAAHLLPSGLRDRTPRPDPSVAEWKVSREQTTLDEMAADVRRRHYEVADVRLAYVPAVGAPHTVLTSMFLHAGLLHLIGNMIFLLAVAPFVEDVYGRPLFIVLYLTGGIGATLAFAARYPNLVAPLLGASGAVAAVMGAYLVRFALSRLDFLLIPIIFLPTWHFRFSAPALVVLPIWFLEQLVSIPMEGGSGVAVTAHVAGFGYGFLFALLMKVTKVESRLVQPVIEKKTTWRADPRLDRALAAFGGNDVETARREVTALLSERPSDTGALRLALDIARSRDEHAAVDQLGARLLSAHAAAGETVAVRDLIDELPPSAAAQPLPQFLARAAAFAERTGDRPLAISLYERLCEADATVNAIPSLVKLANLRRSKGDIGGAREALVRALDHPACSPEWRRKIDNTLSIITAG